VKLEVPGVDKDQITISVTDDVLTVRGEVRKESEEKKKNFYRQEIRYGSFERILGLPAEVDGAKAAAKLKNGLLEITLPKAKRGAPGEWPHERRQLMTRTVYTCGPDSSRRPRIMERDCGCPASYRRREGSVRRLVTDRRPWRHTQGRGLADLKVGHAMSRLVCSCRPTDPVRVALKILRTNQLHRLPVVDENEHLIGVLSLADVAREADREHERTDGDADVTDEGRGDARGDLAAALATGDRASSVAVSRAGRRRAAPRPSRRLLRFGRHIGVEGRAADERVRDETRSLGLLQQAPPSVGVAACGQHETRAEMELGEADHAVAPVEHALGVAVEAVPRELRCGRDCPERQHEAIRGRGNERSPATTARGPPYCGGGAGRDAGRLSSARRASSGWPRRGRYRCG
jgi:hypothetical protein